MKQTLIGLACVLVGSLLIACAEPLARASRKFQRPSGDGGAHKWHYVANVISGALWVIGGLLFILGLARFPVGQADDTDWGRSAPGRLMDGAAKNDIIRALSSERLV